MINYQSTSTLNFIFNVHINYTAEMSTKLIHMLGRTPKVHMRLSHKTLKTIYEGALIPLLPYGAPVWGEDAVKQRKLRMLQIVQELISIKFTKAYRSNLSKLYV